jgi:RNA polymerase sigma-70 factor (ECF subfamily)
MVQHLTAGGTRLNDAVSGESLLQSLYTEHAPALLRHMLRLTDGDVQRAEDIVQETLLRAWLHPRAFGSRPARPWLLAVARNVAGDLHRARLARPYEVNDTALEQLAVPDEVEQALDSWVVADALRVLRPEHSGVLREIYYSGRSATEAAGALGIPVGTVKSRTYYALRALKAVLKERGFAS